MSVFINGREVFNNSDINNPDIDGGTIDGCNVTVGTGKTLSVDGGTFQVTSGAGAGKILTSDGSGNASWADAPSSGGDFLVMQVFS